MRGMGRTSGVAWWRGGVVARVCAGLAGTGNTPTGFAIGAAGTPRRGHLAPGAHVVVRSL